MLEEPDLSSYSILPANEEGSDVVVQPYNSILTIYQLNRFCDSIITMGNHALSEIVHESVIIFLIASFPGHMFCDSRSILNCTIPVPGFNFVVTSYTPFSYNELGKVGRKTTVLGVMRRLLLPKTKLSTYESSKIQPAISILNFGRCRTL